MSRPSESVNVMEDSEECIRLALKSIFSTESLICGISKRRLGKHSSPNEIAVRNAQSNSLLICGTCMDAFF